MKYTAANHSLLAVIKRQYNTKIYKHALAIFNNETKEATYIYLQQFSTNDVRAELDTATLEEQQRRADNRGRQFRHLIR